MIDSPKEPVIPKDKKEAAKEPEYVPSSNAGLIGIQKSSSMTSAKATTPGRKITTPLRFADSNPFDDHAYPPNVVPKSSTKNVAMLKVSSLQVPDSVSVRSSLKSVPGIRGSSMMDLEGNKSDDEDEKEELYGAAQDIGKLAPKKSAGNMSRLSKNSAASSNRSDRLNQIFIMPFIRAASRFNESPAGRYLSLFFAKVTTKIFFWYLLSLFNNRSFLSLANISAILLIFHWSQGTSS
jgi:hypothetical protein